MKFSRKKIQLGSQVEFGGYLITKKGMVPLPRKVAAIMNYAEPRNEIEIKQFLSMCNQFSKYILDLSHMAKPLIEKLKKSTEYNFGPIERKFFNRNESSIL